MSKTQQKKSQKHDIKMLLQLAKLHRHRAACDLDLAQFYEAKAAGLKR